MKSRDFTHHFDFTLEKLIGGREARYVDRAMWPEIVSVDILSEQKNGDVELVQRRIVLENDLSRNKIFREAEMVVIENLRQNRNAKLYELNAHLESHQKLISFDEYSLYSEYEEGGKIKSRRDVNVKIELKVPLLGKMVEGFVAAEVEKISGQDRDVISEYVLAGQL